MPTPTEFLHALILVPVTLLPIINPLSGAPVFAMIAGHDPVTGRRFARQVAINCWFVLVCSLLIGTYVLDLFGISIPIVRVGGGMLVAASGWRMLNRSDDDEVTNAVKRSQRSDLSETEIAKRSFFPITFPLLPDPELIDHHNASGKGVL